jgi:stage II sporulation protein D
MPFKDDRRTPSGPAWIATAVCGALVGLLIYLGGVRGRDAPPELKVPPHRPAMAARPAKRLHPLIRVNLTPKAAQRLTLGIPTAYEIRSLDSQRTLAEGASLSDALVHVSERRLHIGRHSFPVQGVELAAMGDSRIAVDRHQYRGVVRVIPQPSGRLTAVNVLPLEDYVSCVIDAEMPAKFPPAAREAQAIVARTYALWQMQQADPNASYDVFATVRSQKYLGTEYVDGKGHRLAGESASSRQAAAATRGLVCMSQGKIFCTYYSAVCGGATTPGKSFFADADPVLRSVPCEWCRASDKYRWQKTLTDEELLAVVQKHGKPRNLTAIRSIRQTQGPAAGVVAAFELSDGRRTATIDGNTLRQQLPVGKLLSPHFSMTLSGSAVNVEGSGFGHGAGFCQWGASGQAAEGKSAREIVAYYYPGATVAGYGY